MFSISCFIFSTLHLKSYYSSLNILRWSRLAASFYSPLLVIKVEKTPGNAENSEKTPSWSIWNVFILWNSKKCAITCSRENKIFFNSFKQNNPTYFAEIAETRCFNYTFLLFDPEEAVVRRCSSK